jgi:hypothetical protein
MSVQELPINAHARTHAHTHPLVCAEGSNLPAKIERDKAGKMLGERSSGAASIFMVKKIGFK